MRVAADGSHMRWRPTGFRRVADGLLHALERLLGDGDELLVYYNARRAAPLFAGGARERFLRLPTATAWNQAAVPAALLRDRCDVYLGTSLVVPSLTRTPTVAHIHDCIAFRDRAAKPGAEGRYWRRWTRAAVRHARRLTAVSAWTAAECGRWLGVDPTTITVVPNGVDPRFRPATDAEEATDVATRRRIAGDAAHLVLQVGGGEPHKAGGVAAAAVEALRAGGADVVLVRCGGRDPEARGSTVVDAGRVDDGVLLSLYRQASAVVVPSTHEGFGLPVLEAMACGTPVVCAATGALPEVGGDVALYTPAGDPNALAAALRTLLGDSDNATRRGRAGRERARSFTWDVAAQRMLAVLGEAAGA